MEPIGIRVNLKNYSSLETSNELTFIEETGTKIEIKKCSKRADAKKHKKIILENLKFPPIYLIRDVAPLLTDVTNL